MLECTIPANCVDIGGRHEWGGQSNGSTTTRPEARQGWKLIGGVFLPFHGHSPLTGNARLCTAGLVLGGLVAGNGASQTPKPTPWGMADTCLEKNNKHRWNRTVLVDKLVGPYGRPCSLLVGDGPGLCLTFEHA